VLLHKGGRHGENPFFSSGRKKGGGTTPGLSEEIKNARSLLGQTWQGRKLRGTIFPDRGGKEAKGGGGMGRVISFRSVNKGE